jgi:hypothetical protein
MHVWLLGYNHLMHWPTCTVANVAFVDVIVLVNYDLIVL